MEHLNFYFLKFALHYGSKGKSTGKHLLTILLFRNFAFLPFRLFAFHINLLMKIFNHIQQKH